ncbi:MAG TPA: hypothetical protein VF821_18345, partial [Lentzea sp.]
AKINNGNPRRIIRWCADLYRRAMDASAHDPDNATVTPAMVRTVAREQTGASAIDHVRDEIRQVLTWLGVKFRRAQFAGSEPSRSTTGFWVSYGSPEGAGCALLLQDNVLTEDDRDELVDVSMRLQTGVEQVDVVLVVAGWLHPDHLPALSASMSAEPIVHEQWTFNETLTSVLERQLPQAGRGGSSAEIDDRFDRLGRQQANTQRLLEQALQSLGELRNESHRSFARLQRDVTDLEQAARGSEEAVVPLRIPPPVMSLFTTAQFLLDGVDQVGETLRAMFLTAGEAERMVSARAAVRSQLRSRQLFAATGAAAMLRALLAAFRDGVNEWYRDHQPDSAGRVSSSDAQKLTELCRAYDSVYEYVPFFLLDQLEQFTPKLVDSGVLSGSNIAQTRETFSRLSADVRSEVLASVVDGR